MTTVSLDGGGEVVVGVFRTHELSIWGRTASLGGVVSQIL